MQPAFVYLWYGTTRRLSGAVIVTINHTTCRNREPKKHSRIVGRILTSSLNFGVLKQGWLL